MSNPVSFMQSYVQNIVQLCNLLQTIQLQDTQLSDDPTLITRYFATPGSRTDIVAQDVTNAQSALVQVLFAYTSGSPTQQSLLLKMFP